MPLPKPYRTQKWPYQVMRQALLLRGRGLSLRATEARLRESMDPAPPWHTIRAWDDGTIKRAARIMMDIQLEQAKDKALAWRESGHLAMPDAGTALCGAYVRFQPEVSQVREDRACAMCIMAAEQKGLWFVVPVQGRRGVVEKDLLQGIA